GRHRRSPPFPPRRSSDLEWDAACAYLEGLRPPGETDCGEGRTVRTHSTASCVNMLRGVAGQAECAAVGADYARCAAALDAVDVRSEEHTSELQSRENLVC